MCLTWVAFCLYFCPLLQKNPQKTLVAISMVHISFIILDNTSSLGISLFTFVCAWVRACVRGRQSWSLPLTQTTKYKITSWISIVGIVITTSCTNETGATIQGITLTRKETTCSLSTIRALIVNYRLALVLQHTQIPGSISLLCTWQEILVWFVHIRWNG